MIESEPLPTVVPARFCFPDPRPQPGCSKVSYLCHATGCFAVRGNNDTENLVEEVCGSTGKKELLELHISTTEDELSFVCINLSDRKVSERCRKSFTCRTQLEDFCED